MTSDAKPLPTDTPTPYEVWVLAQGIPVVRGYGITDLGTHPFETWDRIGCPAYFGILQGMEGITGMYVAELPRGGVTKPERHLYEKVIYILEGSGSTTLEDSGGNSHQFEWHERSLFAIPLNTPHQLFAAGEPVRYAAFTTAPLVFDLFYDEEFVYGNQYPFSNRFDGSPNFFELNIRHQASAGGIGIWETNFIPDVREALIDPAEMKGRGVLLTQFEIASNSLIGHLAKWPIGRYHKAHHHGGGALLVIVQSIGFSLMWPSDLGLRPFQDGHGDQVVRVDWKPGSVFSPPTGWFHQHFNTGTEPALQLALRNGSARFPFGVRKSQQKKGVLTSTREGGTMIEYEDEDPAIAVMYAEAAAANGVTPDMATDEPDVG